MHDREGDVRGHSALTWLSGPEAEPLHRDEVKGWLNVAAAVTADDALIDRLIRMARQRVERLSGETLLLQRWDVHYDWSFPYVIRPPVAPLMAVERIQYVDTDGATQTVSTATYDVDTDAVPGRIYEAYNETWPTTRTVRKAVTVRCKGGYAVPFTAANATNTLTAADHPYSDGDAVRVWNSGGALPGGLSTGTTYYVVNAGGDDLQLAAGAGGSAISLSDDGSGVNLVGRRLPDHLLLAMELLVASLYEYRGDIETAGALPPGALQGDALLDQGRWLY